MPAKGALSCLPTASQPWDRSQAAGHVSPVRGDIQHHPRRIDHRFKINIQEKSHRGRTDLNFLLSPNLVSPRRRLSRRRR